MRGRARAAALFILITALPRPAGAAAQCAETDPARPETVDPRVGVVLGGGGARGLAHVGVLQVLEELHVPVDLVVGTSMGAVVGGLFAAGLSPDSMTGWLRNADWDDLFRDRPAYSQMSFRRKEEAREFPIPLEVGIGARGLQLPSGLVAGQKLNATLRSMTFHGALVSDFDSLAVPFRAVATDLETGEMVVLGSGDLVDAMRASMSAPGVFTPYPFEGRLMVDGGLRRNLPVDVACELGADVVIAVDVGARLADRADLVSVVDLTVQVTRIMTRTGAAEQIAALGADDILILPDLGDVSATDFGRSLEAVEAGRAAARAMAPGLRRLAVDSTAYHRQRTRRLAFGDPPDSVDYVVVGEFTGRSPGSLLDRIATRPGPLDTLTLAEDIRHLYSLGIYERVDYRLVDTKDGDALVLRVREKPWGPSYMRFRLAISDRLGGEGTYNLATSVLVPQLNDWGAELVADLQVGEVRGAGVELYQPLGIRGIAFIAPRARYHSAPADVIVSDVTIARLRTNARTIGLETGVHIGPDTELAVAIDRGHLNATRAIGPPGYPGADVQTGVIQGGFAVDGLDDPLFPRRGVALGVDVRGSRRWLGATDSYHRLDLHLVGAATRGRTTVFATALGATSLGSRLPDYGRVGLGGFLLLSGYRPGAVAGNHLAFGRVMLFRELGNDRAYAGVSFEAGNAWDTRSAATFTDLRYSTAFALGLRTPLGPVYLGYGTRGTDHNVLYLEVGRSL